jgi:hypothetical protein
MAIASAASGIIGLALGRVRAGVPAEFPEPAQSVA